MNTSDTIRAWIHDRDQMHIWVAISVGLAGDGFSARMTGKVPWEPQIVEDVRRVLAVPEEQFWQQFWQPPAPLRSRHRNYASHV